MRSSTADAGAEDHAPEPLARRQHAAGERDHDRVVTGQHDVDPDDLSRPRPRMPAASCPSSRSPTVTPPRIRHRSRCRWTPFASPAGRLIYSAARAWPASESRARLARAPAPAIRQRACTRSADDLVAGKELGDLLRGGVRRVGAVHRVLADRLGVDLADRAGAPPWPDRSRP